METKLKYFTIAKIYPIFKKKIQNPSRYYCNSIITNLKFQTQSQNIVFQKFSYKNRPYYYYYYYLEGPKIY